MDRVVALQFGYEMRLHERRIKSVMYITSVVNSIMNLMNANNLDHAAVPRSFSLTPGISLIAICRYKTLGPACLSW